MNHISDLLSKARPEPLPTNLHTEVHAFIEDTRTLWQDDFPFARWLGKCKGVPLSVLYMIRGDVDNAKPKSKAMLFFWKLGKWKTGGYPQLPAKSSSQN